MICYNTGHGDVRQLQEPGDHLQHRGQEEEHDALPHVQGVSLQHTFYSKRTQSIVREHIL